jgi:hypothetical protein
MPAIASLVALAALAAFATALVVVEAGSPRTNDAVDVDVVDNTVTDADADSKGSPRTPATAAITTPATRGDVIADNDAAYRALKVGFSNRVRSCIQTSRACKHAAHTWNDALALLR